MKGMGYNCEGIKSMGKGWLEEHSYVSGCRAGRGYRESERADYEI